MVACSVLVITPMRTLQAQESGNNPHTIRTDDKHYITTGTVKISAPLEKAVRIIEDTGGWNEWMFTGMDGVGQAERFLLVYITGVDFTASNAMNAFVDFRFLRSLGKNSTPIPFTLSWQHTENGMLSGVTAVLARKNAMLNSARYEISLSGTDGETEITYAARVRLRGFFEFFVTLNSYTNTIEWYLEKIIGNFVQRILP